MSPYEIGVLMHYYVSPNEHPDYERQPPVWQPTIDRLHELQLLFAVPEFDRRYSLTPRGTAYIEALKAMPLPKQLWVVEHECQGKAQWT